VRTDKTITTKTVFNSLGWKLFERIMTQGVNLVVQIVLARILLPKDFGDLAIISALVNYLGLFVQSGLSTAIIQKKELDEMDVSTLLTASLFIALIVYVLLFILSPSIASFYSSNVLIWPLRVLSLNLFFNSVCSIQTAIYSRGMNFKKLFFRSVIAVPISGTVGILMALNNMGIWALVCQSLLNSVIVVIFMSCDKGMVVKLRFSLKRAKKLYSFSIKILLTSMITGLHDMIRTIVIGKRYLPSELAYYDKAYTYSGYITQITNQSISSVLLPTFSRSQSDFHQIKIIARKSIGLSSFVMFPILVGFASVAKPFVLLILTDKWAKSIPLLMIFCFLRIPGCLNSVDKQVFYALGKSGINLIYEIIFCGMNIITLFFTVSHGVTYIAIGATIVEYLGCVVIFVISKSVYDYSLKERFTDLIKPALSTFVMAVVIWCSGLLMQNMVLCLIIKIALGFFSYLLMEWLIKDENFMYLLGVMKRRRKK